MIDFTRDASRLLRVSLDTPQRFLFGGDGPSLPTRLAEELCVLVARIVVSDFRIHSQLRRQRRYHFGVARGSATECAALTDVLRLRRLTPASECFRARSLAVRCVQMLTKPVESMGPAEAKAEPS